MAGSALGPSRSLLAALLAPALVALLVSPARGRGGLDHGDWDMGWRLPPLPPREDAPRVARFVTHVSDWGALATISTLEAVRGRSFADVISFSDGPPGAGSGVPYMYLSPMQQLVSDLQEHPEATLTLSLAQTVFCRKHGFDPQSPLCVHIMLSGTVTKVNEKEADYAKNSLFLRHPEMKTWPSSHNWFFAKLNITNIWVLDYFGGPKVVTPEEYFNVTLQYHIPVNGLMEEAQFLFQETMTSFLASRNFLRVSEIMDVEVAIAEIITTHRIIKETDSKNDGPLFEVKQNMVN